MSIDGQLPELKEKMNTSPSLPPHTRKLNGRAFYKSLGSPKLILAPMVDQSEFVGTSSLYGL